MRQMQQLRTTLIIFCFACFVLAFCTISSHPVAQEEVIPEDLQEYTEIFLSTYENELETNFREEYRKYFDFHKKLPYSTYVTISKSHGASLEFIPCETQDFVANIVYERIEDAIFEDVDLNLTSSEVLTSNATVLVWSGPANQPMFIIGGNAVLKNLVVVTNKGYFLELQQTGSLVIRNIIVDEIYYENLIIKGSNLIQSWTPETSKNEANWVFQDDLQKAFLESEDVREYIAYPELKMLVERLIERQKDPDYDLLSFKRDYDEIVKLAEEKYGIERSEFVQEIYEYLKSKVTLRKRVLGIVYNNNWVYVIVFSVTIFGTYLAYKGVTRLSNSRFVGLMFGAFLGLELKYFLLDCVPYDLEVVSAHSFALVGVFAVIFLIELWTWKKFLRVVGKVKRKLVKK